MIEYKVRVYDNGNKYWRLNGVLHNEHGPAIEFANGYKHYYLKGKLHNEHGPAVEGVDGYKEWWLNGKWMAEEEHKKLTSKASCQGKVVEIDGIKYKLEEYTP